MARGAGVVGSALQHTAPRCNALQHAVAVWDHLDDDRACTTHSALYPATHFATHGNAL